MLKILLTIKVIDKICNKSERKEIFEQLSKIFLEKKKEAYTFEILINMKY